MRVRFEQVDTKEKEQALIRAVEKTADILNAMDLLENGSGGISVTRDRSTYFCKLTQIYYIESVDKRSFVYTKGGCYETKYRLYELEELLDSRFLRSAKAMIVNIRKIRSVKSELNGRMRAELLNGEQIIISRGYVKELKEKLGV